MDTVITRIIEIEKHSEMDILRAEETSRNKIEEYRRALAEEKERFQARIISQEDQRLNEALQAMNNQTRKAFTDASKDYETRFQNAATASAVKERIIAILLAG